MKPEKSKICVVSAGSRAPPIERKGSYPPPIGGKTEASAAELKFLKHTKNGDDKKGKSLGDIGFALLPSLLTDENVHPYVFKQLKIRLMPGIQFFDQSIPALARSANALHFKWF